MIQYENLTFISEYMRPELEAAFQSVLKSGHYVLGPKLEEFEHRFAGYCKASHCVGVGNGTDALYLSLKALDLPENAEIILPANAYIACVMAVINAGFKPVFVEPDEQTYLLNPNAIPANINNNTAAIMAIHLYGKVCDMDAICALCDKYKLFLIEDCAQAHGAHYKGKRAGSFGDLAAFSFYPTKNLGALGDGGAITTNQEDLSDRLKQLRFYGFKEQNFSDLIGTNSRLDELQAAFLLVKLRHLNTYLDHKRDLSELYFTGLSKPYILPARTPDNLDAFHIFPTRHPQRDKIREYLSSHGIGTAIHYPLAPYRQTSLKPFFKNQSFPISDMLHNTVFSLPLSFMHTHDDIHKVIETLNCFQ